LPVGAPNRHFQALLDLVRTPAVKVFFASTTAAFTKALAQIVFAKIREKLKGTSAEKAKIILYGPDGKKLKLR
jgi:fructose-1-phosphate kinase PfkB-like protein